VLTIGNKAINALRKQNSVLIIKSFVSSYCCGGPSTRNLWIETQKSCSHLEQFVLLEYEGVKVYLHKSLLLNKDIHVYQKFKIPFLRPTFGVKGVKFKK